MIVERLRIRFMTGRSLFLIGALTMVIGATAPVQAEDASLYDLEELLSAPNILDLESARPEIIGSAPGSEVIEVGPVPPGTLDGFIDEADDAPEAPSMSME